MVTIIKNDPLTRELTIQGKPTVIYARHDFKRPFFSTKQDVSGSTPSRAYLQSFHDLEAIPTAGSLACKFSLSADSTSNNNTAIDVLVYLGDVYGEQKDNALVQWDLLGTATFTLSDSVKGDDDATLTTATYFADTVTWASGTYGTYIATETGKSVANYSPANDTDIAEITVPDFGGRKLITFVLDIPTGEADGVQVHHAFRT